MVEGTGKPTTPSKNKNDLWGKGRSSPLVGIVQNFFSAGFDSGQPRRCQNIFYFNVYKRHESLCICYCISFRENGSQRTLNVIGQFQNLSHFFYWGPRFVWLQCKKSREKTRHGCIHLRKSRVHIVNLLFLFRSYLASFRAYQERIFLGIA